MHPYQNIISVIVPDWPTQFQKTGFRQTLTEVINQELPAHLFANIIWVNINQFQYFRELVANWWTAYLDEAADAFYYREQIMVFLMDLGFPILDK